MKLLTLSITNMRRIRAAEFDFDGKSLVEIRGRNGAGKSTVIDSILFLLKGSRDIPAGAVTAGEERGVIVGKLGEYTIRRVIDPEGKSTLTVESSTGKVPKPQEFLDRLSGQFLDPEYFRKLSAREKRALVLVYAGIDFTDVDERIARAEQDRLVVGRELKALGSLPPEPEAVEPVSLSDLLMELADANKKNGEALSIAKHYAEALVQLKKDMIAAVEQCDGLEGLAQAAHAVKTVYIRGRDCLDKYAVPEKVDTAPIEAKIQNAESINAKARSYTDWCAKRNAIAAKKAEYDVADRALEALREEKHGMVAGAKLPLKGLEITDSGLAFNGASCENWSDSESLKIALNIAIAYSGELKAVYIKGGEALDTASLEKLRTYAEAKDFQIIVEVVDDSYAKEGDNIIYIDDGQVK